MSGDFALHSRQVSFWRYVRALGPVIVCWMVLVGLIVYGLVSRAYWVEEADQATLREWLDESRIFRKSLPELVKEYLTLIEDRRAPNPEAIQFKREEIQEQVQALASPLRIYQTQLPLFPDIYRIEIRCRPKHGPDLEPMTWNSPIPRPRGLNPSSEGQLKYSLLGPDDSRATMICEYRLHAYNSWQLREQRRQLFSLVVISLVLIACLMAALWVYFFLKRERERELGEAKASATIEHQKNMLLEEELRRQEAERDKKELDRELLEQRLEAAKQESRAAEAERQTSSLQAELFAGIGIMAGSYAHNIKNLLVRPNDLLVRCIEADGLSPDQSTMLQEVQLTLGTVTERLQQILRTVRRDPHHAEVQQLDLGVIVRGIEQAWAPMARERWKLNITIDAPSTPLMINGDLSHLQQAIENLLFNARDATFEQRNHLRDEVRNNLTFDRQSRQKALIESASWKGQVTMRAYREDTLVVLEVKDNGIGMTEEVRQRCLETHFTTKRGNAVFEGLNTGMGLGLSFVMKILENHDAKLEIESQPHQGALFRVRFPAV